MYKVFKWDSKHSYFSVNVLRSENKFIALQDHTFNIATTHTLDVQWLHVTSGHFVGQHR